MYLNRLTNGEKVAFYSLAHAVAAAHEGISLEEKALLEATLHEMKIPQPQQILSVAEAVSRFESDETRRIALLELMLIAMIDDDFDDAEQTVMSEVLKGFNFNENHVERAAAWAESLAALFRSGQRFIQYA
ncbi:hypothetical protein [Rhodocyclus tenuis]|uniref:hypothetical protein n=1 Tax=Rhodocyclus tenuis TaxID=1066 RepID=UPI0019059C3C|nr:hypothetical protein [Rhodocyclus tenuis]MBK1679435.1 hypothetical protein [Rhodocyclus tenuis]